MASAYAKVHESPSGPGDDRPTAAQIVDDEGLEGGLRGKVILITGCSSGLGVETARALLPTGATLYLTARDLQKARTALGDIANSPQVQLLHLNLGSLESVRGCAAEFLAKSPQKLNILICNAGVMMTPEGRTVDGFETQMGINHLGHFLFFNLLKSALLASATSDFNSRVLFLSSIAHRTAEPNLDNINLDDEYHPWIAYSKSKTASIWAANEIERRYGSRGLHAWGIQPGPTGTGLYQHLSEEMAASQSDPALAKIFKTPQQGAATTVWAAVAKTLEGQGGKYLEDCQISKEWDSAAGPWAPGYASWAYDEKKEAAFWAKSETMVGLKD
ncbi:short-chain dehydrogenase [Thelonectria olida]|uniref:Short-chain dehydrogenase n=1 Tax=Thelonectria olida TaxID=1576542 RepID=A0A9P8VQP5_9HYPO|nr:short-chain dehydrogenase [Thelonectria olida]